MALMDGEEVITGPYWQQYLNNTVLSFNPCPVNSQRKSSSYRREHINILHSVNWVPVKVNVLFIGQCVGGGRLAEPILFSQIYHSYSISIIKAVKKV